MRHCQNRFARSSILSAKSSIQTCAIQPRELHPGDVVNIPGGKRHWHGASKDSWFEHVAMEDVTGGNVIWEEFPEFDEDAYSQGE